MNALSKLLQAIWDVLDKSGDKETKEVLIPLQECITMARSIEENFGFPDLAKEDETLKAELEALETRKKKELHVLKENHHGELQRFRADRDAQIKVLRAELDVFAKAQADRDNKEAELPGPQHDILKVLPPPGSAGLLEWEITSRLPNIPSDELVEHLRHLDGGQYAGQRYDAYDAYDALRWSRLDRGNRYVISQRKAVDEKAVEPLRDRILQYLLDNDWRSDSKAIADHVGDSVLNVDVCLADMEKDKLITRTLIHLSASDPIRHTCQLPE